MVVYVGFRFEEMPGRTGHDGIGGSVHGFGIVHTFVDVDSFDEAFVFEPSDDFPDQGFGQGEFVGYLAVGLALLVEVFDVEVAGVNVLVGTLLQVLALGAGTQGAEVDVAAVFHDFAGDDVAGSVFKFSVPDFDLFDVLEVFVLGALADGEDAVKEVVQAGASGKVVPCDGTVEGAFGRVGDDEQVPVVFVLELLELLHELACIYAFFHVAEEVAYVVHDDGVAFQLQGGFLYLPEHEFIRFLGHGKHGVYLGPEEAGREGVCHGSVFAGVAQLELFVGELAVYVEDTTAAGDFIGHLDGKDGFAQVGVGEEAADLAFVPERKVERVGVGPFAGILHRLVGGLHEEHPAFGGILRFLQNACDCFQGIGLHG